MDNVFQPLPPVKKSFLSRIFSIGADENAFVEFNNLLASKNLLQITDEDVVAVISRNQVDVFRHFPDKILDLFATYLANCVKDHEIGPEEAKGLAHLKRLLQLSDRQVQEVRKKIGEPAFIAAWQHAISDGRLTEEDEKRLDLLAASLELDKAVADEISALTRELFVKQHLKNLMDDRRLSPAEDEELGKICASLNVTPQFDDATTSLLDRYRFYYAIENGVLPEVECDINLVGDEKCHFQCDAQWYEYRSVTRRVNYGGPAVSIRIMKGVYYRAGSMSVQPVRSQELQLIGTGKLYVTDKRIVFVGDNKATTIRYNKIVTINPYSNGVEILKDAGKSPTIIVDQGYAELLFLLLSRLAEEA